MQLTRPTACCQACCCVTSTAIIGMRPAVPLLSGPPEPCGRGLHQRRNGGPLGLGHRQLRSTIGTAGQRCQQGALASRHLALLLCRRGGQEEGAGNKVWTAEWMAVQRTDGWTASPELQITENFPRWPTWQHLHSGSGSRAADAQAQAEEAAEAQRRLAADRVL